MVIVVAFWIMPIISYANDMEEAPVPDLCMVFMIFIPLVVLFSSCNRCINIRF